MRAVQGKFCYAVVHNDGRAWCWGDDASSTKRIQGHGGLPDAVRITRTDGAVSTISLGKKSQLFVIPNEQRIRSCLSLGRWVHNCEALYQMYKLD